MGHHDATSRHGALVECNLDDAVNARAASPTHGRKAQALPPQHGFAVTLCEPARAHRQVPECGSCPGKCCRHRFLGDAVILVGHHHGVGQHRQGFDGIEEVGAAIQHHSHAGGQCLEFCRHHLHPSCGLLIQPKSPVRSAVQVPDIHHHPVWWRFLQAPQPLETRGGQFASLNEDRLDFDPRPHDPVKIRRKPVIAFLRLQMGHGDAPNVRTEGQRSVAIGDHCQRLADKLTMKLLSAVFV